MFKVNFYSKTTGELICWYLTDKYGEAKDILARIHAGVRAELEVTHV